MPGDLFLSPPQTPHSLFIPWTNTAYYCISYPISTIESLFPQPRERNALHRDSPCFTPDLKIQKALISLLDYLAEHRIHEEACIYNEKVVADAFVRIAVGSILEGSCNKVKTSLSSEEIAIKNCIRHIDKSYATIKDVSELAQFSGLSKTMLCKLFLKETNTSVHQYITARRIHEAARLIHLKRHSFAEIAHEVGYSEYSTFYRNFLLVTKMSPSKYQGLIKAKR